jgi:hypothetical protein
MSAPAVRSSARRSSTSAAVYTQTTDVEIEVNGLLTYDRAVVKMDEARIVEAARKLYEKPPTLKIVVPTSEQQGQTWHYTMTTPEARWMQSDFDDKSWKSGPGGFGTKETIGAVVNTEWKAPDIWLRRTFKLESAPKNSRYALRIHHREGAEVYINGKLAQTSKRHLREYQLALISDDAQRSLKEGENTFAVHCHEGKNGQFIDVGLVRIDEN